MQWSDLETRQPRLAAVAHQRLIAPGVLLVVSIRRDGTPRLSPVEPLLLDGGLRLSMMHGSLKAADLLRDPRLLVHGIVTSRDGAAGELKVRGQAVAEHDADLHRRYADAVHQQLGWRPVAGYFHLFSVDIEQVTYLRYVHGDQWLTDWPPGREFVRREQTATSVGDPEPVCALLKPESGGDS